MKNNNNKFITKYLYVSFLLLLIFPIAGCGVNTNGGGNTSTGGQAIIQLTQLGTNTENPIWENYFVQWGAGRIWDELNTPTVLGSRRGQERTDNITTGQYVTLNLVLLEDIPSSKPLQRAQQANEVVKGAIRYLIIKKKQVVTLNIIGAVTDENKRISSLPNEIGVFTNLLTLNMPSNKLTNLPNSLGRLENLRNLNLANNQLASIPTQIGNLAKLQSLNLRDNQLTSLPIEIDNLQGLKSLNIKKNPSLSLSSQQLEQFNNRLGNNFEYDL
jgi:Leucine-rich repeat (LRR) protein